MKSVDIDRIFCEAMTSALPSPLDVGCIRQADLLLKLDRCESNWIIFSKVSDLKVLVGNFPI
jgi:hypothetical protein